MMLYTKLAGPILLYRGGNPGVAIDINKLNQTPWDIFITPVAYSAHYILTPLYAEFNTQSVHTHTHIYIYHNMHFPASHLENTGCTSACNITIFDSPAFLYQQASLRLNLPMQWVNHGM